MPMIIVERKFHEIFCTDCRSCGSTEGLFGHIPACYEFLTKRGNPRQLHGKVYNPKRCKQCLQAEIKNTKNKSSLR